MKISNATVSLLSESQSEKLESFSFRREESEQVTQQMSRRPRFGRPAGPNITQVVSDRVSIRQGRSLEYRSNYAAHVSSRSSVQDIASGQITEYSGEQVVERMVEGVLNRGISIRRFELQEGALIPFGQVLSDGDSIRPVDQGEAWIMNPPAIQLQSFSRWGMSINRVTTRIEEEQVRFASHGNVTTEDGRVIDFSLDISMDRTFLSKEEEEIFSQRQRADGTLIDPLVISLDGNVPQLTDARFEFDLDSDGTVEQINFAGQGSGFLAFDKNNDQVINDGSELFGPGTGNGFKELAVYDEDQNNWIDENDAIFSQLSVWTKDENGEDRLISLKDAGLGAIYLDYAATTIDVVEADNTLQGKMQRTGVFLFENGNVGSIHQIDLATHSPQEENEMTPESGLNPEIQPLAAPELSESAPAPENGIDHPLKDLMVQLDELRKDMEKLYRSMSEERNNLNGRQGLRQSYEELRSDPASLFSAGNGRWADGAAWYI